MFCSLFSFEIIFLFHAYVWDDEVSGGMLKNKNNKKYCPHLPEPHALTDVDIEGGIYLYLSSVSEFSIFYFIFLSTFFFIIYVYSFKKFLFLIYYSIAK